MNNKEIFQVHYEGAALTSHEMNVKDLAPALLALAQILEDTNRTLNGEKVKVSVNLRATNEGGVEVALSVVQSLIDQAASLFNSDQVNGIVNATELLGILGIGGGGGTFGVVKIIKWLRGREIKNVTKLQDGSFQLEVDGDKEVKVVSRQELTIFGLVSVRRAFETVITKPLQRSGVDSVSFQDGDNKVVEITKDEAEYFAAPSVEEEILGESESTKSLQIISPTFQEGGKWKFSDGNAAFFADILDEEFVAKVQQNEAAFAKDDILKVTLRVKQFLGGSGGIKTDYTILKVHEHRSASVQIKLPGM